jgi:hypothetical protein
MHGLRMFMEDSEVVRGAVSGFGMRIDRAFLVTYTSRYYHGLVPYKLAYKPPLCGPCETNDLSRGRGAYMLVYTVC